MTEPQIGPPDPPKPGSKAALQAELLKYQGENTLLRAEIAARDKAAVAVVVPDKRYLRIGVAAFESGIAYGTLWEWHRKGLIDSFVPDGTSEIMIDVNSAIARANDTGLSAKHAKRKRPAPEIAKN